MSFFTVSRSKRILCSVLTLGAMALSVSSAKADNPTFDVIGPHEYALPVNYAPFNVFVQYAYYQSSNEQWNANGKSVGGPHLAKAVGLSKYVRFFTLKSVPDVGFAYEIIQPTVSVQGTGTDVTGFGDPITGPAAWFKPTKNSTLGIQTFLQIPVGTKNVSDHTWKNLTSILYDVQFGDFNIDGDTGLVFQSTGHTSGGPDFQPGLTFHQNLRLGYRAHKYIEPYVGYDFGMSGATKVEGVKVANSDSYEHVIGGGLMFHFSDNISLSTRYSYGIDGQNTARTNSLNIKFAYVW